MEHHHFDQCLMILNSPGNQILAHLSSEEYSRALRVLEDAILSTDLAVYFRYKIQYEFKSFNGMTYIDVCKIFDYRKRGSFLKLVKPHTSMANWLSEEPRSLLRAMSMTVCDLSAITKPWPIEKRVADLVTSEFFEQGDMERQELNITPIVSHHKLMCTFSLHIFNTNLQSNELLSPANTKISIQIHRT